MSKIIENEIFAEIDRCGYFALVPERSLQYGEILNQLKEKNLLISCDELPETRGFMNDSYLYTWSDNRYKLRIQKDGYSSWIIKGV